ncbi:hypothetical protein ACFWR9_37570 [Streptomyces sp. NPDC058534]|uniref:hypothetical protein n=1 Tax=Streptomyces sp. NPDC058534 TaxID=3346541 RepID=UPI00364C6E6A
MTRLSGPFKDDNLSADAVDTGVEVPQEGRRRQVYEGELTVTRQGLGYTARLDAASALLLPPRFTLVPLSGRSLPPGLRVRVSDGAPLSLSGPRCRVRIESQGPRRRRRPPAGTSTSSSWAAAP